MGVFGVEVFDMDIQFSLFFNLVWDQVMVFLNYLIVVFIVVVCNMMG